jgi:2-polyprenyl-6-methoxyphenol hydroxylase-like FAD-dependent oxidoreductase
LEETGAAEDAALKPCDVLIVGAGPTGLALAVWLARQGVATQIIDKTAQPGTTSRALAVQARTLELYRQADLAEAVVKAGHRVPAVNLWVKGERAVRLPFASIGEGMTAYSFLEIFPQDEHERLLVDALEQLGVEVERNTELLRYEDRGDAVAATLRGPQGEQSCAPKFIAGCDGARSIVRETIGAEFPGGTYRQVFYVADIEAKGPALDGELHVDLDEADFLAVFPLADEGRARLIGTVRDERADHADTLKFEDVSRRAIDHLKVEVGKVNWFSTYHVHHRVADHFRKRRAFLLGDAAHIHSPAGGQGMNTGIGDAINLAWKLAAVLKGAAPDRLLDTYEIERQAFARRLVATTDRVFNLAVADGPIAGALRTRLAPAVLPKIMSSQAVREFAFRTVSQITLNYRHSPLSLGHAGQVHGGDRLPWAPTRGEDNFESLKEVVWQVHVYGYAGRALSDWCAGRSLPLRRFDWRPEHAAAGLVRDAIYLLRPDTYVALVDPSGAPEGLARYFADQAISPERRS